MEITNLKGIFINKGLTLGSIESFTGGNFASLVTSISGASNFYKGTLVSYATEIKENVLGIDKNLVNEYGVVSHQIAKEMAGKGRKLLNVDVCISFTGNAGPTAMENKPVGMVFIGIATKNGVESFEFNLKGNRSEIVKQSLDIGLGILSKKV